MNALTEPVYVVGLGASTPVGRDAPSSAAAVRAGICGFAEHPYMIDTAGKPVCVAIAPWLDIACQGLERFESLLFPAMDQALEPLVAARDADIRVALALGVPSVRPGLRGHLGGAMRASIATRYRGRFVAHAILESGHAAAILGLHASLRKMAEGAFEACVVAGAESYLAPETLEWLERTDQLHGAGRLNNAWGFVPGEGAGAALLVTERALERLALEPMGRVLSVGRGVEPNRIKTSTICTGEGLTAAFREGLEGLPSGAQVTDVFCDINGEPYRADEFGFACLRTRESFVSASDFIAPADSWGDVSAASAPLALVLSTIAGRKAYANGEYAFLWASSEGGERGAALLHIHVSARAE